MTAALAADAVSAARRIAEAERLLVALDFDGVLTPLQDVPMRSRAIPAAAQAVKRLAALRDTAVAFVSGRTLADLRVIAEHGDDSGVYLAGSHGAEFWYPLGTPAHLASGDEPDGGDTEDVAAVAATAARLLSAAQEGVAGLSGAWIEPKSFGFALHTRLASDDDAADAADRIDALVAQQAPTWRRRTGQDVREYAWRHEGKDGAVAALRELTGATAVLFAGDDVTDEDALRDLRDGDLGIRVGPGETAARVRVADPAELAELLHLLADERETAVGDGTVRA